MNPAASGQQVRALNDKPLYERAYDELRSAILSGRFRPGERLNQAPLAEQMQVSRAPVLDALTRLTSEGLVEHHPRRGYFVRVMTTKGVANLYNVRCALECEALDEMWGRIGPAAVGSLREIFGDTYLDLVSGNMTPYLVADSQFHNKMIELAENDVLARLMVQLRDQIQLIRVMVASTQARVMRAAQEHDDILQALENQDLKAARLILRHHIDTVKQEVIARLEAQETGLGDPQYDGEAAEDE